MAFSTRSKRNLAIGIAFLLPNILGFLVFTFGPLIFSFFLAWTNWDLRRHNIFHWEPLEFAGFDNFMRLLLFGRFWETLGHTLFLMIGIPFTIAGSLILALLLSRNMSGGSGRVYAALVAGTVLIASVVMLTVSGAGMAAMMILLTGVACGIFVIGSAGGTTVYRTLFYLPHFTAGVAVFLLWQRLYSREGPINAALEPPLEALTGVVRGTPEWLYQGLTVLLLAGAMGLLIFGARRLWRMWDEGELVPGGVYMPALFLVLPFALAAPLGWLPENLLAWLLETLLRNTVSFQWLPADMLAWVLMAAALAIALTYIAPVSFNSPSFTAAPGDGVGSALLLSLALMTGQFVLIGLGLVFNNLPDMARIEDGLTPPEWLTSTAWAKPALMIMGFWAGVGSNNMLLYLAGLSNVPQDLYEAADIDGASRMQKFWHVTWPQLAPTTFFIAIMSVIGGLQAGFEMVRTMTQGEAGTTVLAYYIYIEGFEEGRLGYASALAWALFVLVFVVTLFNWRFGNRYVND